MKPLPATMSTAYFANPGRLPRASCAAHAVVAVHVPSTGLLSLDAADAATVSAASTRTTGKERRIAGTDAC
jgi:hypothetical protein